MDGVGPDIDLRASSGCAGRQVAKTRGPGRLSEQWVAVMLCADS